MQCLESNPQNKFVNRYIDKTLTDENGEGGAGMKRNGDLGIV